MLCVPHFAAVTFFAIHQSVVLSPGGPLRLIAGEAMSPLHEEAVVWEDVIGTKMMSKCHKLSHGVEVLHGVIIALHTTEKHGPGKV